MRPARSSLKVGSGNALLQTPVPLFGFQPYVTAGVSIYHEGLGAYGNTGFGQNVGGGVKVSLIVVGHICVNSHSPKLLLRLA